MRIAMIAATAATAVSALLAVPTVASAQDTNLTVTTNVASYCGIQLANVAGSNVSVANGLRQKVSTLRMSCNDPDGAVLTTGFLNGDMFGPPDATHPTGFQTVNYDWELVVAAPAATLGFAPQDTFPGGPDVVTNVAYTSGLANGVLGDFFLNLCYQTTGGQGPNPPQTDNTSPGSSGCQGSDSEALSAPAGTYAETFTFDLNPA